MNHQSDDLAVPMVQWLGVFPSDISWLGIKAQPFTVADISKVRNPVARPYITSHTTLRDSRPGTVYLEIYHLCMTS
jgi:hypothetical protein